MKKMKDFAETRDKRDKNITMIKDWMILSSYFESIQLFWKMFILINKNSEIISRKETRFN